MLSIFQIIRDLVPFLIVLALVMLMYGNCFIVLMRTSASDDDAEDPSADDGPAPFGTVSETLLTLFLMMLGDFDRLWFLTGSKKIDHTVVTVFVTFQFLCNIVLLNVLIAIVSDTYGGSGMKLRPSLPLR